MKYIASVYSLEAKTEEPQDVAIRWARYYYTLERVAVMLKEGVMAYSPIVHSHVMAESFNMPKEYSHYQKLDRHFIDLSDGIFVLKMPGWERSEGIQDEIAYATETGKPITYLDCEDYEEELD